MRRAILAVLAGGLLMSSTACSDDPKSSGVAAPAAATPSASAEPVVSASATPDYTAANKVVCDRLDKTFDTEFGDFGGALGKLMAVQEEKDTANADKAKKQAATELKAIGTQIRKETADAVDPELKAVAATSAQRIEDSAKDLEFIETIKSMKDLDSSLKDQITEWISPLAGYCGVNRAAPESSSAAPAESPSTAPSAQ